MALVTGAGLLCAGVVTAALGADAKTVAFALLAIAVGSIATFIPAILHIGRDYWGIAVLFSGTARSLIVLAIAYAVSQSGTPGRPLFIGAIAGAAVILIAETAAAIRILATLERRRVALKSQA
jgi:hypothetical protein